MAEQQQERERKLVKVACTVPNGLLIALRKPGYDDGTGFRPQVADGPAVRLNGPSSLHAGVGATTAGEPVETEVDAEWMGRWLDQNAQNPLVTGRNVWVVEEKKDDEPAEGLAENPTE